MIIKFRAWDYEENEMIQADDFAFEEYQPLFLNFQDERFAFEPFTGYCDDNGKEVYHGDIIEISFFKNGIKTIIQTEIEWDEMCCGFGFKTSKSGEYYYIDSLPRNKDENYSSTFKTCKVIGNKHEGVE